MTIFNSHTSLTGIFLRLAVALAAVLCSCQKLGIVAAEELEGFWSGESGRCYEFCPDGTYYAYSVNARGSWVPDGIRENTYTLSGNKVVCEWVDSQGNQNSETYIIIFCRNGKMQWIFSEGKAGRDILSKKDAGSVPLLGTIRPKYRIRTVNGSRVNPEDGWSSYTRYDWNDDVLEGYERRVCDVLSETAEYEYDHLGRIRTIRCINYENSQVIGTDIIDFVYNGRMLLQTEITENADNNFRLTDKSLKITYIWNYQGGTISGYSKAGNGQPSCTGVFTVKDGTVTREEIHYPGEKLPYVYEFEQAGSTKAFNPYFTDFASRDFARALSVKPFKKIIGTRGDASEYLNVIENEFDADGRLVVRFDDIRAGSTAGSQERTRYRYDFTYWN